MEEYKLTPEEEFEMFINQLLDKTEDRELDVELYGYPADYLDDKVKPEPLLQRESVKPKKHKRNINLRIAHNNDGEMVIKSGFIYGKLKYIFEHSGRKAIVTSGNILDIICENDIPTLKYIQRGEDFYVQVPLKILLDHCDFLD